MRKTPLKMESENAKNTQETLYFLVEELQKLAQELPQKYQQRLPCELLSGVAHILLEDTLFLIVKNLMEIQHATEKHLFQQRRLVIDKQKLEKQSLLSKATRTVEDELQLEQRHQEELKQNDMKLILQLDQKVSEQQSTLEKVGVPGFSVTNNPMEVQVQMYLLSFILKLGGKIHEAAQS